MYDIGHLLDCVAATVGWCDVGHLLDTVTLLWWVSVMLLRWVGVMLITCRTQ